LPLFHCTDLLFSLDIHQVSKFIAELVAEVNLIGLFVIIEVVARLTVRTFTILQLIRIITKLAYKFAQQTTLKSKLFHVSSEFRGHRSAQATILNGLIISDIVIVVGHTCLNFLCEIA
jgi:hypothetical protein